MKLYKLNVPSVIKALNKAPKDELARIVDQILDCFDYSDYVFANFDGDEIAFFTALGDYLSDQDIVKELDVCEGDLCMSAARVLEDPTIEDHLITGDF